MIYFNYLFWIVGFLFFGSSCMKQKVDSMPDKKILALTQEQKKEFTASNEFGFDLYKALAPEFEEDNMVISPFSIRIALSMLANGAKDNTLDEILSTIKGTQGLEANNKVHQSLIEILSNIDQRVVFQSVQSIWHDQNFKPNSDFLDVNRLYYNAEILPLDFSNPLSKDIINDWVSKATQQKIQSIIEDISPDHIMFLINAIYYKGLWRQAFEKKNTFQSVFFKEREVEIPVEMMFSSEIDFGYFRDEKMEMVSIPFGRGNFQLSAIMPAAHLNLDEIVKDLDQQKWEEWQTLVSKGHGLHLYFPKFEVETKMELSPVLSLLGMPEVFTAKANLKGIHDQAPLEVSEVNHKTYLKVDEAGAEAAAVTSVGIVVTSLPPSVIFNRPFLLMIHELETDCILFLGSIREP